MTELADEIRDLHQPGLNRVPVPSIISDAPACTECRKAWPCPTIQTTEHHQTQKASQEIKHDTDSI